jgi:hypothetical protein
MSRGQLDDATAVGTQYGAGRNIEAVGALLLDGSECSFVVAVLRVDHDEPDVQARGGLLRVRDLVPAQGCSRDQHRDALRARDYFLE